MLMPTAPFQFHHHSCQAERGQVRIEQTGSNGEITSLNRVTQREWCQGWHVALPTAGREATDRQLRVVCAQLQTVQMLNVITNRVGAWGPNGQLPRLPMLTGRPGQFNPDGLRGRLAEIKPDMDR